METPPPLPTEEPPHTPSPPPPSKQASNQIHNRLDFDNDAGGLFSTIDLLEGPPSKRARICPMDQISPPLEDGFDDEGPDTLLGSGLAAEFLEEGEIFDSESILSRNESCASSKSRSHSPSVSTQVSQEGSLVDKTDVLEEVEEPIKIEEDPIEIHPPVEPPQPKPPSPPQPPSPCPSQDDLSDDEKDDSEGEMADPDENQVMPNDEDLTLKPTIPSQAQEEFEIIDDVESDLDEDGRSGVADSDLDSDDLLYDEDEIDALLDQEMEKNGGQERGARDGPGIATPLQKEKIILIERGNDPFDILPEGWIVVTHNSGMPMYLHKQSRVCTLSRPYFLGPGSARKHDIPVSAIPCLQYRRALERGDKPKDEENNDQPLSDNKATTCPMKNHTESPPKAENNLPGGKSATSNHVQDATKTNNAESHVPNLGVRVETAKDHEQQNSLNAEELRGYCEKLFLFKAITVKRFKTWKDRRKHNNMMKKVTRPALPSSTKLIRCAIPTEKDSKINKRKEFVLNPAGKSDICILHEYVQQALRVQPRYIFEELANSQTPFSATIMIEGEKYGTGFSSSKKGAKLAAAKQTLSILIPEINKLKQEEKEDSTTSDLTLFDTIKIEDPRITELCIKAGQPGPFQVLVECLKRNYGVGDTHVQMEMKALKHQKSEFIMRVGKHEAKVVCKNKREGKQQAAQSILQKMHPHIHTWGSLLRLYDRSIITKLEDSAFQEDSEKRDDSDPEIRPNMSLSVWFGDVLNPSSLAASGADTKEKEIQTDPADPEVIHSGTQTDPDVTHSETQTTDSLIKPDDLKPESSADVGGGDAQVLVKQQPRETFKAENVSLDWAKKKQQASSDTCPMWRHCTTQTEWEGRHKFHKTTQFPAVPYSGEDVPNKILTPSADVQPGLTKGMSGYPPSSMEYVAVRSGSGYIIANKPKHSYPRISASRPAQTLETQTSLTQSHTEARSSHSPTESTRSATPASTVASNSSTPVKDETTTTSPVPKDEKPPTTENQDTAPQPTNPPPPGTAPPGSYMIPPSQPYMYPGMYPYQAPHYDPYQTGYGNYVMTYMPPGPGVMNPYVGYGGQNVQGNQPRWPNQ